MCCFIGDMSGGSVTLEPIGPHLLSSEGLSIEQIEYILSTAEQFREVNTRNVKKVPTLRGKTVINLFLEPSTRTRTSFEIAAKRLSAESINISGKDSSATKGETLIDTVMNLQSMAPDAVVIRHASSGAPNLIARHLSTAAVINAGDGLHEHPTQALLDLLTMRQALGKISGLTIAIVGDALRSRVMRSNLILHRTLGNKVRLVGPPSLVPREFEALGAEVHHDLAAGIAGADVVMSLRVKFEYLKDVFIPNLEEYSKLYYLNEARISQYAPQAIVMAPGPIVRGVEIDSALADGPRSHILQQVENGVAVRMAVLFLLVLGKRGESDNAE